MKKLFLIGLLALGGIAIWQKSESTKGINEAPVLGVVNEVEQISESGVEIAFGDKVYKAIWVKANPEELELYPNFEAKEAANIALSKLSCEALINGGFYKHVGENSEPIGLFKTTDRLISDFENNKTHDGVFYISTTYSPIITASDPGESAIIALQSGPIIKENGSLRNISMIRDKYARRIVALVTGRNELYFVAFYEKEAAFSGPTLAIMPKILSEFENITNITAADAINLDGGSASAFLTQDFSLSEVSPIGSYFCLK